MKKVADEHSGRYEGQQGWIRRWRRYGAATEEMWDNGDGQMGWKYSDGIDKFIQGTTTNLRAYRCSNKLGLGETTDLHGDSIWSKTNNNFGGVLEALRREYRQKRGKRRRGQTPSLL